MGGSVLLAHMLDPLSAHSNAAFDKAGDILFGEMSRIAVKRKAMWERRFAKRQKGRSKFYVCS